MNRWEALVRYDSEIRAVAQMLAPYGSEWIDKMGTAFFALKEDRKYLAEIVSGLIDEAERQLAEKRARVAEEKAKAALTWLDQFRITASSEKTSEDSIEILLKAIDFGYSLAIEGDGAFSRARGTQKAFLRSNREIQRYGAFLKPKTP